MNMKAFIRIVLFAIISATVRAHRPFGVSSITSISRGGGKPKKRVPTQIIVAAFNDASKADRAADLLKDAAASGVLYFRNLAVIRKYKRGGVVMHETGDQSVGFAATVGMFVGGLSLLFLGPAGVLAGGAAGGLVGGAGQAIMNESVEQESDASLDKERVLALGEILDPGSSALVIVFEEVMVNKRKTKHVKMKFTQDTLLAHLALEIRKAMMAGKDVAFAISVDEDGIAAVRMVSKRKAADIQGMIVTKKGTSVGRATATREGIVYEVAGKNNDGAATFKAGSVDADGLHETVSKVMTENDNEL